MSAITNHAHQSTRGVRGDDRIAAASQRPLPAVSAGCRPESSLTRGGCRVLVLSGFGARLFEAIGGPLVEVREAPFPMREPANPTRRAITPTPAVSFAGRHRLLLGRAAAAIGDRAAARPATLLVVGPRRDLRRFADVAGPLDYVTVRRTRAAMGIDRLTRLIGRRVTA